MDMKAARDRVYHMLQSGHLPSGGVSTFIGSPANGEMCDVCADRIVVGQLITCGFMNEATPPRTIQFHVQCFEIWQEERLPGGRRSTT